MYNGAILYFVFAHGGKNNELPFVTIYPLNSFNFIFAYPTLQEVTVTFESVKNQQKQTTGTLIKIRVHLEQSKHMYDKEL